MFFFLSLVERLYKWYVKKPPNAKLHSFPEFFLFESRNSFFRKTTTAFFDLTDHLSALRFGKYAVPVWQGLAVEFCAMPGLGLRCQ